MTGTDRYEMEVEEWLEGGLRDVYGMPWRLPEDVDLDEFLKLYRKEAATAEPWFDQDGCWVEGEEVPGECYEWC